MKKLLTILSLMSILSLNTFAQDNQMPCKDMRPGMGMGQGMQQENCGMHKGKAGMGKNCGMGMMDDDKDRDHFGPMMMEQLDLSKEQMDKIHQIRIKNEKLDIDFKAELKKMKIDKMEAMKEMNFDKAKEVTKKMAEVRTKSQIGNIDEMIEITKVLSKEQLEKMKEMHKGPGMMKHKMMNKEK